MQTSSAYQVSDNGDQCSYVCAYVCICVCVFTSVCACACMLVYTHSMCAEHELISDIFLILSADIV